MSDEPIPLSQIADIIGGFAFKSGDFGAIGFPVVKIANIEPPRVNLADGERIPAGKVVGLDRFQLSDRDIVMAMTGATIGKVGRVCSSEPSYLNQRVAKLSAKAGRKFDDFIFALVTQAGFDAEVINNSNGSAQANISTDGIGRILVPDFSPDEQLQIGRVIGALDDKIELNRRMNETLEALAQSLFKSWFVDATQSALPKGWRESTVDDEFNLTMGQSPPGESYNETGNGIPFYQGRTDFGFRFPTARVFCTAPTRFANAGDTLVSVRAPVGSVNMATEKCSVGRGVAAARHKSGSRSYTYYFMRSLEADFACFEGEGTVFGSINKADFHAIKRAAPPSEIIEAFEKMLFPIDQRIENNEKESRTLAALRDALLPKLLSGELRVPAALRKLEASA